MPRAKNNSDKQKALQQHGTLNPRPQDVRHPLFQNSEFFDPSDLLQVKYEMLRQVHVDKRAVSRTAKEFGFSRPSFYQAEFAFEQGGLSGLLPQKRGPRNGHKLTPEVMKFVAEQQALKPSMGLAQLAEQVQHNFHVKVHPRSIERQLQREKNSDKFAARSHCRTAGKRWMACRVRRATASTPERTAGIRVGVIHATGHEGMDDCLFALPRTASSQRIYYCT